MSVLKIIVVGLALSNVAYYLWAHGIAPAEEPAPAQQIPTLRLASEVPPAARAPAVEAVATPGADTGAGGATRCISIGPFHDVPEAAHAATMLRGGGYDPRQRVAEGDVWAGIWVYLPVPQGSGAGEQLLAKLKAAGIDDALEMPGPVEGSVISLGLYGEQKRAQARVQQAQALGLKPSIADRKRTGDVYWVDVDLKPSDGVLNPADLQPEAGRITRLELRPCPAPVTAPGPAPVPAVQP